MDQAKFLKKYAAAMVRELGPAVAAKALGVAEMTVLRVIAGAPLHSSSWERLNVALGKHEPMEEPPLAPDTLEDLPEDEEFIDRDEEKFAPVQPEIRTVTAPLTADEVTERRRQSILAKEVREAQELEELKQAHETALQRQAMQQKRLDEAKLEHARTPEEREAIRHHQATLESVAPSSLGQLLGTK